jgi:2-methylcitrate dehydratase
MRKRNRVSNIRTGPDQVLSDIAAYVCDYKVKPQAINAARLCLTDTLAGALDALDFEQCTKLLGPIVPGIVVPQGARVPGTRYVLDPVTAAFSFGCMIRWLDFNDQFSAAQGSHPSDNLAGIWMLADYLNRQYLKPKRKPLFMHDVLEALVKAYEIQGCIALENDFGEGAVDQNLLVRVASTAVLTRMLGGTNEQMVNAISNAWIDCSLVVYRHAPNAGLRKCWASADASSEAVRLALMAIQGEMGYPTVLSAKHDGLYDARFHGKPFRFQRMYGDYVIQNSMFKFVPAAMHGQTAVECAFLLHPLVKDRLNDIVRIDIQSHAYLLNIMNKIGPLYNSADRDHCAQYMVALGLIHGKLNASDYGDDVAADPRIDQLREKMNIEEEPEYTKAFFDPLKRSNANAIQIHFRDGSSTKKVETEYPVGHPCRRLDCQHLLQAKLDSSMARRFSPDLRSKILKLCADSSMFNSTPVDTFTELFVPESLR